MNSSSSNHRRRASEGNLSSSDVSVEGRRRRARQTKRKADSALQGSVLWTLFWIGIVFCLLDVVYIIHYVSRRRHDLQPSETLALQTEADSGHVTNTLANNYNATTTGKEPLIQLLEEAQVELNDEIIAKLPTWSQVAALYGEEPVVWGLDTCTTFQQSGEAANHFVSVAGTFNTGTNLLAELLIHNCYMPARTKKYGPRNKGVRWQVLWGKHTPVGDEEFRLHHRTYEEPDLQAQNIFPAVTVRDPMKWMQSMCRHKYAAHWKEGSHCPNLVLDQNSTEPVPVTIKYKMFHQHHDSLVGFWNDWYHDYAKAPFPRLLVRFEDVIFHPKHVTKLACECAGGQLNKKFKYIVDSAKKGTVHGKHKTSYVDALIKYGTDTTRYDGFEPEDLEYAREHLDPELMKLFGYKYPNTDVKEQ